MRVNLEQLTMDMEERDWNYFMPAYMRAYLFGSKGNEPIKIVFPKFKEVVNPTTGNHIPVEWVEVDSPVAQEIKADGAVVPETTPAEEAAKDQIDNVRKEAKAAAGEKTQPSVTQAPAPTVRKPRQPATVIPPGSPLNEPARDPADNRKAIEDLRQEGKEENEP